MKMVTSFRLKKKSAVCICLTLYLIISSSHDQLWCIIKQEAYQNDMMKILLHVNLYFFRIKNHLFALTDFVQILVTVWDNESNHLPPVHVHAWVKKRVLVNSSSYSRSIAIGRRKEMLMFCASLCLVYLPS